MENNKFYFKKSKGQNFLQNKGIIKKIVNSINLSKNKSAVIEIGPGNGAITDELISKCKKLIIIEIDPMLVEQLKEKYKNYKNIVIIKEDILNVNLKYLIETNLNEFNKNDIYVFSNLPYYITSPIIFRLFSINELISSFVLMMQKEVGKRISAAKDTKKYNNLSITTNFYCDIEKVADVGKNNFYPIPKVDSIVLKFIVNKKYQLEDEKNFINFIRLMFQNKRKTILNNLKSYLNNSEKAKEYLEINKLKENLRPENLSLKDYYILYRSFN